MDRRSSVRAAVFVLVLGAGTRGAWPDAPEPGVVSAAGDEAPGIVRLASDRPGRARVDLEGERVAQVPPAPAPSVEPAPDGSVMPAPPPGVAYPAPAPAPAYGCDPWARLRRAGNPQCVAPWARFTYGRKYCGYYVGGGAALYGRPDHLHGEPRYPHEGTWGMDYAPRYSRVRLQWFHGTRYQAGEGQYEPDEKNNPFEEELYRR